MFRGISLVLVLSLGFFGLATYGVIDALFDLNRTVATFRGQFSIAVNFMGSLICLLVSYGLWKAKRWGWWLGSTYSAILVGMTLFGVVTRVYIRSTMPFSIKGQAPQIPIVFTWEIIWTLLFISLLILLFLPAVTARVEGISCKRGRNAWILGGIGLGVPVVLVGVIFLATPFFMREFEPSSPPREGLFGGGIEQPTSMVLSPDGNTLAVEDLSKSNCLTLLDISSGKVNRCPLPGRPFHYCWSPDSRMVAVDCGSDAGIAMVDVGQRKVFRTLKECSHRLAFHPDGSLWNLDYRDNTLWRIDTNAWTSRSFIKPCSPVQDFAISPDGKMILLAWGDYTRMNPGIMDPESGKLLGKWSDGADPYIQGMRFSHDGRRFFTTHGSPGKQGTLKVWNARTGKMEYEIPDLNSYECDFEHIDLSRDDVFLSARNRENRLGIWSLSDRHWIWEAPGPPLELALTPAIFGKEAQEFWTGLGYSFDSFRSHETGFQRWNFRRPTTK